MRRWGRGLLFRPVLSIAACAALMAPVAHAGEADVMRVHSTCNTIRTCDFEVTVRHADVGWSHYADRFEIVAPDGQVLETRVLQHPHVHEQPFTRGLVGVEIPPGIGEVTVRAGDTVHGLGGDTVVHRLEFPDRGHQPGEAAAEAEAAAGAGERGRVDDEKPRGPAPSPSSAPDAAVAPPPVP